SDPSGNTVYVGGASGGVWRTNDFLTTKPTGPTYISLTDFGPATSLNIGAVAVFGRNNDTNQSVVFAGTGDGDQLVDAATAATNAQRSNLVNRGLGFLRS